MQTNIASKYRETASGREADAILRSCVHCGFCTATCPTYQLLGDELDGPRGRIYLIKQVLEGKPAGQQTRLHLDRCLTCRSCETTCPSGVHYGRLVDIGRGLVEREYPRSRLQRGVRWLLRAILPYPRRFGLLLRLGRGLHPLMPRSLQRKLPNRQHIGPRPQTRHTRRYLVLEGCVQSVATPLTNAAAARVLDRFGVQLIAAPQAGCCGAVSYHLGALDDGLDAMRRLIDAWWPFVDDGIDGIVISASGCGAMVREYGALLSEDPAYAAKATHISLLARDLGEVIAEQELTGLKQHGNARRVAFHSPCTLQHGQKITGVVESILERCGYVLTAVKDPHLCCGSAGTYSILQPELAGRLRDNKLGSLRADSPEVIATANIGCQLHLQTGSRVPVVHWIELLDAGPETQAPENQR
jgi:glycolate oxidase iron-sulfur subunit